MSATPIAGALFRRLLLRHFTQAVDVTVTFVDCHEEAIAIISDVIENRDFVSKIIAESKAQRDLAASYQDRDIDCPFGDLTAQI